MVGVAQLVERWIVIPVVVGSIPIVHPIFLKGALIVRSGAFLFWVCVAVMSRASAKTPPAPCNPLVAPQ